MLEVGTKHRILNCRIRTVKMHKLSDYRGKKVILYFYSKDNTAGCTKQACGYSRDILSL